MTPTRRELLRLVGAGAAGLGVAGLGAGCGDDDPPSPTSAAAAVLDPDASSFIVVVWTRNATEARITVRADGATVADTWIALAAGSGSIRITGLRADRAHEVTIDAGGLALGPHQVRTAPHPDDPRPIRIAISADVDPSPEFASGIFDAVVAEAPELYVSLGDFPYADNAPGAQTVEEYRQRHREVRTHPPVRALLEAAGMYAIYDDHEFRNDWDAHFAEVEHARYLAATQVWDEFFPVRTPGGEIRYRRWRWGAHLECFLLDCRRFRSADAAADDAAKTMLGETQRAWLVDGVTASTATFKLILTSVALDFGLGIDHWSSFTTERDAIFAALVGTPGVLFVSADQHWFASHRHAHGIREMQVGPLARGIVTPGDPAPGVLYRALRYNAGLIEIDGDQLTFTGLGEDGERFYAETVTSAELTPAP